MRKLIAILIIGASSIVSPQGVQAAFLNLIFQGADASISEDGGPVANRDLTVDLIADTASLSRGSGFAGSDRYSGLTALFSSVAMGFSNVAAVGTFSVDIGTPDAVAFTNAVLLFDGHVENGLFGSSAVGTWDRVSPVGPLFMPAASNGSLSATLTNGHTLLIANFDNSRPFADSTFRATLAVPEPGTMALLGIALIGAFGVGGAARYGLVFAAKSTPT